MRWSYKTVHFELKKEGLLGSTFIDEYEMEETLNDFGKSGWELVSMLDVRDGVIAVFKQPIGQSLVSSNVEVEDERVVIPDPEDMVSSSEAQTAQDDQPVVYEEYVDPSEHDVFTDATEVAEVEKVDEFEIVEDVEGVEEVEEVDSANEVDEESERFDSGVGAIRIE